ncbi:hypothetical protein BX611_1242 [Lutibacter oceani]|uniref:DUF4258 domain-containing protein n=1 Tax=Lutibacter oceani TaxID=1853311 RepID=A0A3D9RX76_9FLAO|nr:hypothetical protein [Lutibacter oceani]REE81706.1 hypothetical protein BX611_1242 [Lutibacter oceani]
MTFKQRLPFFLGGLTIGIIIVIFVFGKKNTSFDYGPNARVLKTLRVKERIFSEDALKILNTSSEIDTVIISQILKNGNVDLMNKIKLDSCLYQYNIKGKKELKNITLTVINCNSSAIIKSISIN